MKSTLKLSLAAMLLGLSVASLLRADDQPVPLQSGPSIQAAPPLPPGTGEKPPPHMMDPQRMLQMLSKRLSLTDDQKAKILPLLQAQADQLNTLRNDPSLSDIEKHEKMRTIVQASHKQIGDLLTPEQKGIFKDMRRPHGYPPPPPPANNPPPADNPPPPSSNP